MGPIVCAVALMSLFALLPATRATADEGKLDEATHQVESGARKAGQGIADRAKGVGDTVVEGAKAASERIKDAGKAAQPEAETAWQQLKDGAWSAGRSVRAFFTRLFAK